MTLKRKILVGYGVTVALLGLVVAWAVANIVSLGNATGAILSENYRSILAAGNMVEALQRQNGGVLLMYLGDTKTGILQFREDEAVFHEWLGRAKDNITIEGEAELVHSIDSGHAAYRRRFSELTELHDATEAPLHLRHYLESVYPLFAEVRERCIQLRELNESTMYAASMSAQDVAARAIWSTILVSAAAMIAALGFSYVLAMRIVQPIRGFVEASRKISSGDYSVQVPVTGGDELGSLAGEFNGMAAQLSRYHDMNIEQIISEKNKGEAILSSIEDGLVVFDADLKVTAVNPAARRILNLTFSETSSLGCEDLVADRVVCELIRKTMATGVRPDLPEEQRIISLSEAEQPRHYLFSVTTIRARDRGLSGIVLLLRDVTRLKEVEQLKSEFVMAASHQLRTPLTSMGMSVDLLLEHATGSLSERDRSLLDAAHEEIDRMKALVNDLLDLSKIEAGRIEMEFRSIRVASLYSQVERLFESQVRGKEVSLTRETGAHELTVRADANKIIWVLTNLISNALRYVSKGGHIGLSARQVGSFVHLSVTDDGPGIPAEYQTRIFHKFVQVKGQPGGTGLGLAICKEIVRAHGGTIWVESSPGRGSTFTFTVPVA